MQNQVIWKSIHIYGFPFFPELIPIMSKKLRLWQGILLWSYPLLNWIITDAHLCPKDLGCSLWTLRNGRSIQTYPMLSSRERIFKSLEEGTPLKREMIRPMTLLLVRLCINGGLINWRVTRNKSSQANLYETDFSPSILWTRKMTVRFSLQQIQNFPPKSSLYHSLLKVKCGWSGGWTPYNPLYEVRHYAVKMTSLFSLGINIF